MTAFRGTLSRLAGGLAVSAYCLTSSLAFVTQGSDADASDKVVVNFTSEASSGVSGQAMLNGLPQGGTVIHGKLSGLQPNVEYVSQAFTDAACGTGPATQIDRFTANANGAAVFNAKIDKNLSDIKSVSVQLGSDQSLKACAPVNQ